MKKRIVKILLGLAGLAALALTLGLLYLQTQTYPANPQATAALTEASSQGQDGLTIFKGRADKASLIFYQGALVEPDSYAFLGKELAAQGYNVYIIHSPLNLPILDRKRARQIIEVFHLEPQQVILGGHSLGGVVASADAADLLKEKQPIKGLVLLASYPARSTDLTDTNLAVLSITASQDKVLKWDQYEEAKTLLPAQTAYQQIQGGNHSGFGLYGQQKGDGPANISPLDQQKELVRLIADFMDSQEKANSR